VNALVIAAQDQWIGYMSRVYVGSVLNFSLFKKSLLLKSSGLHISKCDYALALTNSMLARKLPAQPQESK
jgi:hypothetical protein